MPQLGSMQPDDEMAGGGTITTGLEAPVLLPVTADDMTGSVMPPADNTGGGTVTTGVKPPTLVAVTADESGTTLVPGVELKGAGTTTRGLMPGLPLSTVVSGSAPLAKSEAAFGSGGAVAVAGLPGVIGLQTADKPTMPNAGVVPAGVVGMIPLAALVAAVVGTLVGDVAMPEAGQAVIAPSGPICAGAPRLPRLRKMPPIVSVAVPGRGTAVGMPG
jgi:hypothetical protein